MDALYTEDKKDPINIEVISKGDEQCKSKMELLFILQNKLENHLDSIEPIKLELSHETYDEYCNELARYIQDLTTFRSLLKQIQLLSKEISLEEQGKKMEDLAVDANRTFTLKEVKN